MPNWAHSCGPQTIAPDGWRYPNRHWHLFQPICLRGLQLGCHLWPLPSPSSSMASLLRYLTISWLQSSSASKCNTSFTGPFYSLAHSHNILLIFSINAPGVCSSLMLVSSSTFGPSSGLLGTEPWAWLPTPTGTLPSEIQDTLYSGQFQIKP